MQKRIRKKRCIICGESFLPFKTTQRVCGHLCAIAHAKSKEAERVSGLNRLRNERVKIESLSKLMESTTMVVHRYIRQRDKGKPCISCGQQWNSSFQAGHRYNVKQFNGLRYHLLNIHGQCEHCNLREEGNYDEYHLRLPSRIGKENLIMLEEKAKICKRIPHTWTRYELKSIQEEVIKLRKKLNDGEQVHLNFF